MIAFAILLTQAKPLWSDGDIPFYTKKTRVYFRKMVLIEFRLYDPLCIFPAVLKMNFYPLSFISAQYHLCFGKALNQHDTHAFAWSKSLNFESLQTCECIIPG